MSFYNNSKRQLGDNVRERCDVIRLHVEKINLAAKRKTYLRLYRVNVWRPRRRLQQQPRSKMVLVQNRMVERDVRNI